MKKVKGIRTISSALVLPLIVSLSLQGCGNKSSDTISDTSVSNQVESTVQTDANEVNKEEARKAEEEAKQAAEDAKKAEESGRGFD